ncbi:uncharacterized protein LOC130621984 [Hydractinia symbiolongicarpus]|uniref:uncharacterized protein LOC130621984 n=1 Tax=Hydractinia symbiolongicarpus TaxID=13093 RepID=UPI00254CB833|nr:uncharacterized protein LOC130621982 isoform X1 [Hydractinia symbiolongicarpus]XP_057293356.1 uncharacterized protein LOC130621982 isoform X1 [Hydractinia symbiolongicarpus]XP_057293357.1 uncharacterized protein LOC130621982 isoform X1 [Hydractinia symbiolongicarpus]XP_057293359.1 uncharacterized protein LOC130621984 [Hydractinia symbiolongicarpus]XP_057293360.1 uncharacterized protein LOC130621984 [Hydractinia symbiolongicarpus]
MPASSNKLFVKFLNESGEDADGVTRDFFASYWLRFNQQYGYGENMKFFMLNLHNLNDSVIFTSAGRILLHGFIVGGYLPLQIAPSLLYRVLFNKLPSKKSEKRDFVKSLGECDQQIIENASRATAFDATIINKLLDIFSNNQLIQVPVADDFKDVLEKIAFFEIVCSPHFMTHQMASCDEMFDDISEDIFLNYVESLRLKGQELVKILKASFSTNQSLYGREERVYGFVERYVSGLNQNMASKFTRFVSGMDVMPFTIRIEFKGASNPETMFPIAHTCGYVLEVSPYFLNYEIFKYMMNRVLMNRNASERFHLT